MIKVEDAINKAYAFTGLPAARCIWDAGDKYLLFMCPPNTPANKQIDMGALLTFVRKADGKAGMYNIIENGSEFEKAKVIFPSQKGGRNGI